MMGFYENDGAFLLCLLGQSRKGGEIRTDFFRFKPQRSIDRRHLCKSSSICHLLIDILALMCEKYKNQDTMPVSRFHPFQTTSCLPRVIHTLHSTSGMMLKPAIHQMTPEMLRLVSRAAPTRLDASALPR